MKKLFPEMYISRKKQVPVEKYAFVFIADKPKVTSDVREADDFSPSGKAISPFTLPRENSKSAREVWRSPSPLASSPGFCPLR